MVGFAIGHIDVVLAASVHDDLILGRIHRIIISFILCEDIGTLSIRDNQAALLRRETLLFHGRLPVGLLGEKALSTADLLRGVILGSADRRELPASFLSDTGVDERRRCSVVLDGPVSLGECLMLLVARLCLLLKDAGQVRRNFALASKHRWLLKLLADCAKTTAHHSVIELVSAAGRRHEEVGCCFLLVNRMALGLGDIFDGLLVGSDRHLGCQGEVSAHRRAKVRRRWR